ncbi:carbohydrate ABC transporter permease [Shouchella clausii]|uniref:carbohydrate ABC transporter permease n=1 Tax=Shouchella clausii TaxID=79880 RepID=UPI000BA4E6B0|nr:sugar ABC transporter permease [Shouchella clausii]PAD15319.1 ABC transporter permease [Shouchella clausii]PTL23920.1 sugar ABC transporter permease [Shouchella clausii]
MESPLSAVKRPRSFKPKKRLQKDAVGKYMFVLPGLLFLAVFMLFPIGYNVYLTFHNVTVFNIMSGYEFTWLDNYKAVLTDTVFLQSVKNSIVFTTLCLLFQFVIGLALALFFNKTFPGRGLFRALLLMAWMIPLVITGTLFQWMFAGEYGIINHFLLWANIVEEPIYWVSNEQTALYSTIIANIWIGIPFNMVILLAGLQSLPTDIYEAARVDGASKWRQFFAITLPLLKPTLFILVMLGIIYTFKVFDIILIMTKGGPLYASTVMPFYAYEQAFINYNFSIGATITTVMLALLIVVSLIYLRIARKEDAA